MKKIFAMLLIGMFVLSSVPFASAENQSWRAEEQRVVQEYNQLKQQYNTVKDEWKDSKAKYLVAKQKLKRFKQLTPEEQVIHFEEAQDFMIKTLGRMENYLKILQKWSERVVKTTTEQDSVSSDIDNYLAEINMFKEKVEGAKTVEDLKYIGKEIKTFWKETRAKLKKIVGTILSEKVNKTILSAGRLSVRLHDKIDALDQKDKTVKEMQNLILNFDDKVTLAKEKYEKAKNSYSEIQTLSGANKIFGEANKFLREADRYLKDAHKDLRKLVKLYRSYKGNFPTLEPVSDNPEDQPSLTAEDE